MSRSTGLPNLQVLNFSPTMFAVSHFCAGGMLMKQSLEFEHTPAWWHGIQIYYWKRKWTTMKLLCHIFRKLENKFRYYTAGLIIITNKYTLGRVIHVIFFALFFVALFFVAYYSVAYHSRFCCISFSPDILLVIYRSRRILFSSHIRCPRRKKFCYSTLS